MGQLSPLCFATEETTKVMYAFAFGYNNNLPGSATDKQVGVLLKTNAAPSSPSTLTWSVVSTVRRSLLFDVEKYIHCIAEPDGVFTLFGRYYPKGSFSDRPGGFRFDPTTSDTGSWSSVDIAVDYAWTRAGGELFYLTDAFGKRSVYHAFFESSYTNTVNFGVLNTATNVMVNSPVNWTMPFSSYYATSAVHFTSNTFYAWEDTTPLHHFVAPLPQGPLSWNPPTLQQINFSPEGECNGGYWAFQLFWHCTIKRTYGVEYKLFVYNGNMSLPAITPSAIPYKDPELPRWYEVIGDGTTFFMLFQSDLLSDSRSTAGYSLKSIMLTGPSAGQVEDIPNGITVSDNISYKYITSGGGGGGGSSGPGSGRSGSGSSTSGSKSSSGGGSPVNGGMIAGILVAVVLFFGIVAYIVRRRKRPPSASEPTGDSPVASASGPPQAQGTVYPQPATQKPLPSLAPAPISSSEPPQAQGTVYPQLATQRPLPSLAPAPISSSSPPLPLYSATQPALQLASQPGPPMGQVAPKMYTSMPGGVSTGLPQLATSNPSEAIPPLPPKTNATANPLLLSSHPRPNVVTSVGSNTNNSNSSTPSFSAASAATLDSSAVSQTLKPSAPQGWADNGLCPSSGVYPNASPSLSPYSPGLSASSTIGTPVAASDTYSASMGSGGSSTSSSSPFMAVAAATPNHSFSTPVYERPLSTLPQESSAKVSTPQASVSVLPSVPPKPRLSNPQYRP